MAGTWGAPQWPQESGLGARGGIARDPEAESKTPCRAFEAQGRNVDLLLRPVGSSCRIFREGPCPPCAPVVMGPFEASKRLGEEGGGYYHDTNEKR